jgi:hypothetical protein
MFWNSRKRQFDSIPVKSPTEWLDAGARFIYENMYLAGSTNLDGHAYDCRESSFDKSRLKLRSLYSAYNAVLAHDHNWMINTIQDMYEYAASYGDEPVHDTFKHAGNSYRIRKGLLALDHPTRDEHAPALPTSPSFRTFDLSYILNSGRLELSKLPGGHSLHTAVDEDVVRSIVSQLDGKGGLRSNSSSNNPCSNKLPPNAFNLFWIENEASEPVLALHHYSDGKITTLVRSNKSWWSDQLKHRLSSRDWNNFDVVDGFIKEEYVTGYGSLPSKSLAAFEELRGLFQQLGDEQAWLRLSIDVLPDYRFSEYDLALSMRDQDTAHYYAEKVLNGRWFDYERRIIGNPKLVVDYARIVLLRAGSIDDWPEGEADILRFLRADDAIEYALRIRKRRWIEAEPLIGSLPRTAIRYAEEMLQGEFPDGEKEISLVSAYSYRYASLIGKRFEPGELIMKVDYPDQWQQYCDRFPDAKRHT